MDLEASSVVESQRSYSESHCHSPIGDLKRLGGREWNFPGILGAAVTHLSHLGHMNVY